MIGKRTLRLTGILSALIIMLTLVSCENGKTVVKGIKISVEAAKVAPLFKAGTYEDMNYRYFEPAVTEGKKYPVILYLHGEEEAGTDNEAQVTTTECASIWIESDHLETNPVFVIAPQIDSNSDWTKEPVYGNTLALLDKFIADRPAIDRNRIYIVGFSSGATGVWNMILKNPSKFACAMPISGNANSWLGKYDAWAALKNMPVFVVHSYDDHVSPISGSLNALASLEAGGNRYSSSSASRCLWQPGSTPVPHDAWYTAFHKFEVVYNSLFFHSLENTNQGEKSPTTIYTKKELADGITRIWDYALSTCYVIERSDKAIIVDAMMGHGNLLEYLRENVLKNKDIAIEFFLTHNDNDHTYGLKYFAGSDQLKKVYVHEDDKLPVIKLLGEDADKIQYVKDGDIISLGDEKSDVIFVPGHSKGHTILRYKNYLLPGDAIGTGYVGVGDMAVEDYIPWVEHLLTKMGSDKYVILGGHTGECRMPMDEKYVHDLLACAKGVADGSVRSTPYWRNARYVATYGEANITHDLNNIHPIKGALLSLTLSEGILNQQFTAWFTNYTATVGKDVKTIDITPTVRSFEYKALTINGSPVKSGDSFNVKLDEPLNRFSIAVTDNDNSERIYTLYVKKSAN